MISAITNYFSKDASQVKIAIAEGVSAIVYLTCEEISWPQVVLTGLVSLVVIEGLDLTARYFSANRELNVLEAGSVKLSKNIVDTHQEASSLSQTTANILRNIPPNTTNEVIVPSLGNKDNATTCEFEKRAGKYKQKIAVLKSLLGVKREVELKKTDQMSPYTDGNDIYIPSLFLLEESDFDNFQHLKIGGAQDEKLTNPEWLSECKNVIKKIFPDIPESQEIDEFIKITMLIVSNDDLAKKAKNFTLGHELGHILQWERGDNERGEKDADLQSAKIPGNAQGGIHTFKSILSVFGHMANILVKGPEHPDYEERIKYLQERL